MNKSFFSFLIGVALVLAGLFVSADQIVRLFRGDDSVAVLELLPGGLLFKIGLIVLGTYTVFLRFLREPAQLHDTAPTIAPANRIATVIFAVLLICATLLRLYRLNYGIWFDEMLTYVNYMPLTISEIVSTFTDPNNHMLYSVLSRLSLSTFGDSVWAFRLPAVAFGIGSIAALYYFARRVTSTTVALFSAALLTFSYHHIWFSQNARGYTALLFFTLLSSSLLLDALRQNSRRKWLFYSVAAFLGVFSHLTMAFVVIAHFVVYAVSLARDPLAKGLSRWTGMLFGFIPLGLLSFQGYALILPSMFGGSLLSTGQQGDEVAWTNPVWAFMEVVKGMQIGFSNSGIALVAATILAIGMIDFARKKPEVIGLFLIPTLLGLLLMTSIGYTLFPRFFFFAMGFGVVVVMQGAAVTGQYLGRMFNFSDNRTKWVSAILCAGIVAASLPSLRWVYLPKQNFVAAIDLIEREKGDNDTVVTVGIADFPFNKYYRKNWENVETGEDLDNVASQTGRIWLVYTMPVHAKSAYPEILDRIERDYELVDRFYGSLNGGDVVVHLEKSTDVDRDEPANDNN